MISLSPPGTVWGIAGRSTRPQNFTIVCSVPAHTTRGSTTTAPRSAYPGAPPPAPATLKGAQRPAMTSPASGIPSAPYRGAAWAQGYASTQPTYRYPAPQTYAYTPHTTTQHPGWLLADDVHDDESYAL
uniref:Uncharacterized protein n=1 Tax=Anopheles culicifacies TaxID=139723 RepID=A0A182MH14_9DIPT